MTWVDIGIVALPLVLAMFGLFQGFVRQAASWAGLILGHLAGIRYYPAVQTALRLNFPRGNEALAYAATFVAVYVAVRLVGVLVERWVRGSRLSGAERLAGGLAGIAKGALLAILMVFLLTVFLPRGYEPLEKSRFAPAALSAAVRLSHLLPRAAGEAVRSMAARSVDQPKNRPRK